MFLYIFWLVPAIIFFIFLYERPQKTSKCLPLFNKFRAFPPDFCTYTGRTDRALV